MKIAHKTLATLLATGLTLGVTTTALAFGSHGHGCDMGGGASSSMRAVYQLDSLSDEQRTQLKELMRAERDSMRELRDAMQDNRDAITDAMQEDSNAGKIEPLAKKQGDLIAKMMISRAQLRDKVNAILTDEQRKEVQNIKPQKRVYGDKHRQGSYQGW